MKIEATEHILSDAALQNSKDLFKKQKFQLCLRTIKTFDCEIVLNSAEVALLMVHGNQRGNQSLVNVKVNSALAYVLNEDNSKADFGIVCSQLKPRETCTVSIKLDLAVYQSKVFKIFKRD